MQSILVSWVNYGFANCDEGQGILGQCQVECCVAI